MLKTGKKIVLLLLALALALGVLAGCGGLYKQTPLDGYTSSNNAAESNGGFVVKKDNWYYFINGAEDYTAENKYGDVEKGALMRISESDLSSGNYAEADVVVPLLMVSQDYTAGVFVYGDYVYYATPNAVSSIDGTVENSYLDFKRSSLDGSETMKSYYVQVSDNTTAYRYVEVDGTVYLLYVDSANTEIHSYNTVTGENTVLVSGYSAYAFDSSDPTDPTVYYTMPVVKKNTYEYHAEEGDAHFSTESYNQLYSVRADATACPYEIDLSDGYVDNNIDEGKEGHTMEYVNLGTLVLDGIGNDKKVPSPFNHDWSDGVRIDSARGYTYSIVKYQQGELYLSVTNLDASAAFIYVLPADAVGSGWNSITANPGASGSGELVPIAVSTANATSSALFYKEGDSYYYIYVDANNAIVRVQVSASASDADYVRETTYLARQQTGASLLYLNGGFLYYSKSGTNGNALWRVRYDGARTDYVGFGNDNYGEYKAVRVLELDYNSSWYAPEVIGGSLFFGNAESYAENYVYVMDLPETNTELAELNEVYEEVQDTFTEIANNFTDAANAAHYYYYAGSREVIDMEEHLSQYEEEDLEVLDAYITCGSSHGYDFGGLQKEDGKANVQSYFYNRIGLVTEEDAEAIEDALVSAYLLTDPDAVDETEEEAE